MEIKKVDNLWVIYFRSKDILVIDKFLDLALFRVFKLLRK